MSKRQTVNRIAKMMELTSEEIIQKADSTIMKIVNLCIDSEESLHGQPELIYSAIGTTYADASRNSE